MHGRVMMFHEFFIELAFAQTERCSVDLDKYLSDLLRFKPLLNSNSDT